MNWQTISKRVLRDTVKRAKNKVVTKTTGTILNRLPQSKNPVLAKAGRQMARATVQTVTDFILGYAKEAVSKKRPQKTKRIVPPKIKFVIGFMCLIGMPAQATDIVFVGKNNVPVTVEIADEADEQQRGLMFRRSLPENTGMLFLFDVHRPVSMWMKNTFIPLDMLFFNEAGVITTIARDTVPLDETLIHSGGAVRGVLEVNAGFAARHHITVGDVVQLDVRP